MHWPAQDLASQAPDWRIINLATDAAEQYQFGFEADLLVIYQSTDSTLFPLIDQRRQAGKKTLVEYNDNFYQPPPSSTAAVEWASPLLWQLYESFMQASDGVVVTGEGLKELFSSRVDAEFFILKNQLANVARAFEDVWQPPDGKIHIGWGGSLGHISDLLSVVPLIRSLILQQEQLYLYLMGNESLPSIVNIAPERLRFTDWGSVDDYFEFLTPIHLGIIPLLDTPYNRCRSDVKAIEYASRGVLPILPDALPYREFLQATELTPYTSHAELEDMIDGYMRQPERIEAAARRCFDYVKKERIGSLQLERKELYEQFLAPQISNFNWPVGSGMHEIRGTNQVQRQRDILVQNATGFIKNGGDSAVVEVLRKALETAKFDADLALLELRCMQRGNDPNLLARVRLHCKSFPKDLRLFMLLLQAEPDDDQRRAIWQQIFGLLESEPANFKRHFAPKLAEYLIVEARRDPSYQSSLLELHNLVPNIARLRFELGIHCARDGDSEQAAQHFEWLADLADTHFHNNEKFFQQFDRGSLLSWRDGLRAQLGKDE